MTEREKPIELISKWDVVNKLIQLENNYQFYKEQWDADVLYRRICELEIGIGKTPPVAYNLSPTEQKWIPVTERLPEVGKKVLVYCKENKNDYEVGAYSDTYRGFFVRQTWYENITHWMPLPEPPEVAP